MNVEKIGVGITTYNHEDYFQDLFNSLPLGQIDDVVAVNGGNRYEKQYDCDWIQHHKNRYPAVCRNDCITFLLNKGCEHIFIIEDDMVIKNPEIFNEYIKASKVTGLKYFSYVSMSAATGTVHNRNPKLVIEYGDKAKISFYANMCNEFTYHHRSCFERVGIYDTNMREAFDVDLAYRESVKGEWSAPFWWFADLFNADDLIENNPKAQSRLQAERPDGSRVQVIGPIIEYFKRKHGIYVKDVPMPTRDEAIQRMKEIYERNKV
jgi:glycosyltransferase involved in cell wall biosynthesis